MIGAADDVAIRRGWRAGEPAAAIARGLGRSASGVRYRAVKLGLAPARTAAPSPRRCFGPDEIAAVRLGYACGEPAAAIARRLRRSPSGVRGLAVRLGLVAAGRRGDASPPRPVTPADRDHIVAGYARGDKVEVIALEIGRTAGTVTGIARRMGLRHPNAGYYARRVPLPARLDILRRYAAGEPVAAIAARHGVGLAYPSWLARTSGFAPRRARPRGEA